MINEQLPDYKINFEGINQSAKIDLNKINLPENFINWRLESISKFINKRKVILPYSGGKDSVVAYQLLRQIMNSEEIVPIFFNSGITSEKEDLNFAKKTQKDLQFVLSEFDISNQVKKYIENSKRTDAWLIPDSRAIVRKDLTEILAKENDAVIIDPFNRSELVLALYSEDVIWSEDITASEELLKGLYSTEVLALGQKLNVPNYIIQRPQLTSETGTYKENVVGDFKFVDSILYRYVDMNLSLEEISKELGHSIEYLYRLEQSRISGEFERTGVDLQEMRKTDIPKKIQRELNLARGDYL